MPRFDLSQYSTVAERIDKFWEKYPDGRIHTEIVHFDADQVVIKAEIYTRLDDDLPTTVDYAEERPDTSPVNRVSFVENCATSAIGRALADLGGEFTDAFLDHRCLAARHQLDLGRVHVDADDLVPARGETRGGHAADVAQTENADSHDASVIG